jgi:hypothetical protein
MILTAALTGLLVIIGNLIALYLVKRYVQSQIHRVFYAPDPEHQSQFGQMTGLIAAQIASSILTTFKMSSNGLASGDSRAAKKAQSELAQSLITAKYPAAGVAMGFMPEIKTLISKNPEIVDSIMQFMANRNKTQPENIQPALIPGDNGKNPFNV